MKRFYEKNELYFALTWIGVYVVLLSLGDNVSASVGIRSIATLPIAFLLCFSLFMFLKNNHLLHKYGLIKPRIDSKKMLYYVPLILLLCTNLLYGVGIYYSIFEIILYVLTMFCVGFLEEVIFRGLLFHYLKKDSLKWAIIITSLTFGMGHIVNLINGSGAELFSNFLQVIYAAAAGFMFVMVYIKCDSLIPCIITHGIFNALSIFASPFVAEHENILGALFMIVVSGGYAFYLHNIKTDDYETSK